MTNFSPDSCSSRSSSPATLKGSRLQAAYNEIVEENVRLHSQFERALPLQEQWEQIKTENKRLISQITTLKSERDELQNRFELSVQTNRDLTARLSEEKRSNTAQRDAATSLHARELEKLRTQSRTEIEAVTLKLDGVQRVLEQERVDAKLRERTLVRLTRAAERYFGQSFNDVDDLLDRLENPANIEQQIQEQELTQQKEKADKLVRQLKGQLRHDAKRNAELQREGAQREVALDEALNKAGSQVTQLQRRIAELETEKGEMDSHQRANIGNFQAKVNSLSSELTAANATVRALQEEARERRRAALQERENHDAEVAQAQAKVNELLEELREARRKKDDITKTLQETEFRISRLEKELGQKKEENESLQLVYNEVAAELKALRELLGEKFAKNPAQAWAKVKARISKLQKALEEQNQKMATAEATISRQSDELQQSANDIRLIQEEKEELEKTKKEAESELRTAQARIVELSDLSGDSVLPQEAFQISDGDSALVSALLKIASNQALQPGTKLKTALKTVKKYYDLLLEGRNEALTQALSENQSLSELLDRFLVNVSITATDSPIRLTEFVKGNVGKSLVKQIGQMRSDLADLRHEVETKAALLRLFSQTFKKYYTTESDVAVQFTEVNAYIDRLTAKSSLRSRQLREAQAEISALKNDPQTKILAQNVEHLENQLQSASAAADKLGRDLAAAEATIESLTVQNDQSRRSENLSVKEDRLTPEINRLKSSYELLSRAKADDEQEIASLQKKLQSMKERHDQDSENYYREAAKQLEEEKAAREASFQRSIVELHDQLAGAKGNIKKLAELRNEAEAKLQTKEDEIVKLTKEGHRIASQLRSLRTQIENDRKVADSALQAARITAEKEYHAKLAEQLSKAAAEKRALLTIGIESFRGLFNPSESLTEQTFKSVLTRAGEELHRLQKSDRDIRKLLGPSERQTTEDAVAQLVLHLHD
jgi:chromosome segregation ATPase